MSSLTRTEVSVLSYFRSPFPSTKGFSAYRMPGAAVHGPLILTFVFVVFFLCWPHPMLRPLLIIWVLGGLYLGRDFTILCHYSPLLTLIAWGASAVVLFRPAPILRFGASHVLEIYNVQLMRTNKLDDVSGVCITTIQRLFSMTRSQPKRMPISSPITPMLA